MKAQFTGALVGTALLLSSFGVWAEPPTTQNSHVQILAASCAICHGTNGNSVDDNSVGGIPTLAGLDKAHFTKQMLKFMADDYASTVMYRQTKGLTIEEINQLGQYFSEQRLAPASLPKSPSLSKD